AQRSSRPAPRSYSAPSSGPESSAEALPAMNWIVRTALNLRVVVVALAAVLMIFGIRAVQETPLDVFPEFAPPLVEIQTEAPGLSTVEVESLISVPIENA